MALITAKEVIKFYSISRKTLYNWMKAGCPYVKNNGVLRFEKDKVWEWVNK